MVTKEVLDIYDKYEQDFTLLYEPWASKKDRKKVSGEQASLLDEYVDNLYFVKVENLSDALKNQTIKRIEELEKFIDNEVVNILKERINSQIL